MAILQPLVDLVQLCHLHGMSRVVISPGSRSAALTLAFARNPNFSSTVVMDERAAGFIAMGMAQQMGKPVALVCTSGSAVYNFAPAVAEAFFQKIPLLILTADRPREWIHQQDGQTIYQQGIYGKHVKASYDLPSDYVHPDALWYINRSINEAISRAEAYPPGPVHINVPIREPFYPEEAEVLKPSAQIRIVETVSTPPILQGAVWHQLLDEWEDTDRILIALGQQRRNRPLSQTLAKITEELQVPVIGDVISNLSGSELCITKHDLFLSAHHDSTFQPELLITAGQSFLSKPFKQYLRKHPPQRHWHIENTEHVVDPFQSLTTHIRMEPDVFFARLFEDIDYRRFVQQDVTEENERYLEDWMQQERAGRRLLRDSLRDISVLNDISAVGFILDALSDPCQLHIANSMPIRYVNMLGVDNENVEVFCNRGTSGIDGCVSTAIGAALVTSQPVYLLVGDVAFFYDRNGLLIQDLPRNLKIILLNNAGGVIFRMIDGPARQPELEHYFETRHSFSAKRTAEDSGMDYYFVDEISGLSNGWAAIHASQKASLLEIKTDPDITANIYRSIKEKFRLG